MCKWPCNWIMNRGWKNFETDDSKSLDWIKKIVGRNMDIEGASGESSEGSEGHRRESSYCLR